MTALLGYVQQEIDAYKSRPRFVAESLAIKVAERVAKLMEEKHLNQRQLGDLMGVSRSRVSSVLNAPPNMTFLTFVEFSLALGVTPDVEMHVPAESHEGVAEPSRLEDEVTMAFDPPGRKGEFRIAIA